MAEVGNLGTYLGVILVYFYNGKGGLFIRKDNISNDYYD